MPMMGSLAIDPIQRPAGGSKVRARNTAGRGVHRKLDHVLEGTMAEPSFQDLIPHNYCWGCDALNEYGLHIHSRWVNGEAVCIWQPQPLHGAGPRHILNGGIIAARWTSSSEAAWSSRQ
jgi:hypothetical protein